MIPRLAWSVLLVLLGAGCASRPGVVSTAEIYLTGLVQRDASGQDTFDDLTVGQPNGVGLTPNSPLSFAHEAKLHIHDEQDSAVHDYAVLVGPDYETGATSEFQVKTSAATLNLIIGWAMLLGELPIAETDLVSTSPQGTRMAVRVQQTPRQHYVYNLEPATSQSIVNVVTATQTVRLPPDTYVVVAPDATGAAQPIPPDDPFVAYMQARAAIAEF
jgi:hypothetical protein